MINSRFNHVNLEVYYLNLEVYHLNLEVYHLNLEVYHLNPEVYHLNFEVYHLNPEVYHLNLDVYNLNLEVYHLNLDVFHLNLGIYHLSHRFKFNSSSSFIFWKVGPDKSSCRYLEKLKNFFCSYNSDTSEILLLTILHWKKDTNLISFIIFFIKYSELFIFSPCNLKYC